MEKLQVIAALSSALDRSLVEHMIDEFVDQEERFALHDWKPATLDGGRFAEAVARLLYHQDSGVLGLNKQFDECVNYLDDLDRHGGTIKNKHASSVAMLQAFRHLTKSLRLVYKLRSQRGAVHISAVYTANELDSRLIIENCRWIMAEILRLFWTGSETDIAQIVRDLVTYDIPIVSRIGSKTLVMRTDLSVVEETLVLSYVAGDVGVTAAELHESIAGPRKTIESALNALSGRAKRQILRREDGRYQITALGIKRVREGLGSKLALS